jgi:integrase
MALKVRRLTAISISRANRRGYLCDGGGLYLQVSASGSKSWVFRFRDAGRLREMGLGSAETISLAEARDLATDCRKLRLSGIDPIHARREGRTEAILAAAKALTFRQCAEAYIEDHRSAWKHPKHAAQWPSTLEAYVYPVFGDLPVQSVDVGLVLKALKPIWGKKTETASRVRGRIEAVLDWATANGYRQGDNPARWRGHLDKLLPRQSKVAQVRHHAALPYAEAGAFMARLRQQEGVSARALDFLILTAARTGEVLGATWDEVNLETGVWTVPAARIKAGKEHRVPLSGPALDLLQRLHADRNGHPYVFPGAKAGKPLSDMALLMALRRLGRSDLTVHGFRSTFRMWAAEQTNIPREVAEQALAHSLPDKVEAAYQRSDLFEKRRKLMDAWAAYCGRSNVSGNVIALLSPGSGGASA